MPTGDPRGGEMAGSDLDDILRAIREVDANLDRRAERAAGAVMVTWGIAAASIFAFYHVVALNPDPYVDALGGVLNWVWLGPIALAYVASIVAGARAGRLARSEEQQRAWKRSLLVGSVPTLVAAALVLADESDRIPGAILLWLPAVCIVVATRARGAPRVGARALAVIAGALGLLLLAWPTEWSSLVAAVVYGAGLAGLGTLQYASAR